MKTPDWLDYLRLHASEPEARQVLEQAVALWRKHRGEKCMSTKSTLDCRACGLCCVAPYDQPDYVDCTDEEAARLPPRMIYKPAVFDTLSKEIWYSHTHTGPTLKTKKDRRGNCVCVALKGTLGKKVECTVYATRPRACHDAVKPGDKACLAIRRADLEVARV